MMLVTGGAVAGASALLAAPVRQQIKNVARGVMARVGGRRLVSLANGTFEDWQNVVGTNFYLGGVFTLRLAGVQALPTSGAKPPGVRTQGFAAFFDPSLGQWLAPNLIYTVVHSNYGPMPLFLASAGGPGTPRRMIAVFN